MAKAKRAAPAGHALTPEGIMLCAQHMAGDPQWKATVRLAARSNNTILHMAAALGIGNGTLSRWLAADAAFREELGITMGRPRTREPAPRRIRKAR